MPRGKRTVYAGFCPVTGERICTVRLHKKDKSDFKIMRYSPGAKKRVEVKLKEEKHST